METAVWFPPFPRPGISIAILGYRVGRHSASRASFAERMILAPSVSLMEPACRLRNSGGNAFLETSSPLTQRDQLFVRRPVVIGPVGALSLAFLVRRHGCESARPVKIQIGIEVSGVELLNGLRMHGGDCAVSHLFSYRGSILAFNQRIVGSPVGARLGELFHQ